jgi:hypothetical protein
MDDHSDEFIADEGVPAVAVLALFYRDTQSLMDLNIIKKKRGLSELSTQLSSPHRDDVRTVSFQELEQDLQIEKENFLVPYPKKLCKEADVFRRHTGGELGVREALKEFEVAEESDFLEMEDAAAEQLCMVSAVSMPSPFRRRVPVHHQNQVYRITVDKNTPAESIKEMVLKLCTGRLEMEYNDGFLTDIRVF